MKLELSLRLSTLLLIAPLALTPLGCDGDDDGGDEVADTTDTTGADTTDGGMPDLANGQAIHDSTCAIAGCHSATDTVQLAERVPMMDAAALTDQIRNGSSSADGTMPGFGEASISADDLVDLIAFLQQNYP